MSIRTEQNRTEQNRTEQNKYRLDIDGLRALAVVSVVLFHLNPRYMGSGFLGVDIFFVISGYLITSIIYREMTTGVFSFANFYTRRIKRILPVFFVVLFVVFLFALLFFLPLDLYSLSNSVISSVLFVSNLYFARSAGGYFDVKSEETPFLHIWSLSVEEQFYFVFPLFLLFIFRYKFLKNNVLKIILGLSLLIIATQFIDLKSIGIRWDIYYLPHLRMIEMLTGSFLAIYLYKYGNTLSKKQSNILGVVSLVVMLCCLFAKDFFVTPHFPGYLSLLPCMATSFLILANEKGEYVSKLFSFRPMVWIGNISYSLYLWHWVVLAIFRYYLGVGVLENKYLLIAVVLMFVLSVFSYYFVEQPTRHNTWGFKKNFVYFYVIPAVILLFGGFFVRKFINIGSYKEYIYPYDCHNKLEDHCILGDLDCKQTKKILVLGDSHAGHLSPFIDIVAKKEGWKADFISFDACPFLFELYNEDNFEDQAKDKCTMANKYLQNKYQDYDIIVFSYYYKLEMKYKDFIEDNEKLLQKLTTQGKKVYVLNSSFESVKGQDIKLFYFKERLGQKVEVNKCKDCDFYKESEKAWLEVKENLYKNPKINVIDLFLYLPDNLVVDGTPILIDSNHFNVYGSKKLAQIFIKEGKRLIKEEDLK